MNIKNVRKLRDHLQWLLDNGKEEKFDMDVWFSHPAAPNDPAANLRDLKAYLPKGTIISATECGTVACLAGHAALIGGCPDNAFVAGWAREWLGLSFSEAALWFYGDHDTLPEAIEFLTEQLAVAETQPPLNPDPGAD